MMAWCQLRRSVHYSWPISILGGALEKEGTGGGKKAGGWVGYGGGRK